VLLVIVSLVVDAVACLYYGLLLAVLLLSMSVSMTVDADGAVGLRIANDFLDSLLIVAAADTTSSVFLLLMPKLSFHRRDNKEGGFLPW